MNKKNQFIYTTILFAIILASLAVYVIRSTSLNGNFQWESLLFFMGVVSFLVIVYYIIKHWQKKLLRFFYILLSILAICFCIVLFGVTADMIPIFIAVNVSVVIVMYACDSFLDRKFNSKIPITTKYIITILSCSIFTIFHVWNIIGSRQLLSALEKAKMYGYMLHPEECNEMYKKKIEYNKNGGELVLASCKIIASYHQPISQVFSKYDSDRQALEDAETLKKIEQALVSLENEFEILERGLSYPQQIIPIQFPELLEDVDSMNLSHLSYLNNTVKLLIYKFVYEIKSNKDKKSLNTLKQIFKIAAMLELEPLLISELVRNNIERLALKAIKMVMNDKISKEILNEFLEISRAQCVYRPLKLESEIMYLRSILTLYQKRKVPYFAGMFFVPSGLLKQDVACGLEKIMHMVLIHKRGEKAVRYSLRSKAKEERLSYWYFISNMFLPALGSVNHSNFSRLAIARCVFTSVQLRLHELRTKQFPTDIEFLVKEFPVCTSDPFTGKSLIYKKNLDECVVYSVGNDMKDGGGAVSGFDYTTRTKDIGISLRKEK
ncbi:hypothetical protein [Candidatus Uabimicrobium sp. HlEnr_7]|uniref:hypothetical protein n=1 Tax=Candidatus Uabimicrobium helgolandensis TaxID=3095367 RepID=UPI0035584B19